MKIALIYAGPYRASEEIKNNHQECFGGEYDIYVSCFEHYLDDWKNSEWPVKEYFVTPEVDFKSTNWSNYRDDAPGQSGFWQFWNLKSVIEKISDDYDFIIKSRNDIIFNKKFIFDKNILKKNILYSPEKSFHRNSWDEHTWVNDEFYIGCSNTMKVISKFVTDYYKTPTRHQKNYPHASNESQLRIHLKENGIEVEKIYEFEYRKDHYGVASPSGYVKFQLEKI